MDGRMDGWMDGWMDVNNELRNVQNEAVLAYSVVGLTIPVFACRA